MNAEVIAIGTELLLGYVLNSDTVYLGRVLAELGIDCYHQVTVGDNRARLEEVVRTALGRANVVITCGGLGPTVDDITLETIARATGRRLVLRPEILRAIRTRFKTLGIQMPPANKRQALLPEGAVAFPNKLGTAPGFLLPLRPAQGEREPRMLVALPGPPFELIPMVEKSLIPRLRPYTGKTLIRSKTLKIAGITESEIDKKVRDILKLRGAVTVGIYAHPSLVELRITAKGSNVQSTERAIAGVERKIRRRLGDLIFGADADTLEGVVGQLLRKKKLTLGLAESCTGGLVQHRITEVAGSSDYFRGGFVTYTNEMKIAQLGVPPHLIRQFGAVSPEVACSMAANVRRITQAELGLAITGIAGPTGGSKKKPVGLVHLALSTPAGTQLLRRQYSGARSAIKFKASQSALNLIRQWCLES